MFLTHPFRKKSSDKQNSELAASINDNLIPAIEVKGEGDHGLFFCTPSIHKNGYRYEILGTRTPVIDNNFDERLNNIFRKYNIPYLESTHLSGKSQIPISELFSPKTKIYEGHNRHEALLRIMESLIRRTRNIFSEEEIKKLCKQLNESHCVPPLDNREFEKQWLDAKKFIALRSDIKDETNSLGTKSNDLTEIASYLFNCYNIVTMQDTDEVYYYCEGKGIYIAGGEILLKTILEEICPSIKTHEVTEIIDKVKRRTYKDRCLFDHEINVINLKNGLLDIGTEIFRQHSSRHLSLVQLPITYNPEAKCPNILKFLGQVFKPKDVFTALEFLGYCLLRRAKYEKALMCVGKGSNGKSTFLRLIECFLGKKNVSHVSLQDFSFDKFAASDLYGKMANIFADLKTQSILDSGIFKVLVSGDSLRAQEKHKKSFSFNNYAKIIFSANQIPEAQEDYAYFRRWTILVFDRIFEGVERDSNLIARLTTDSELSGLLNLALVGLRQLKRDNGFKDEKNNIIQVAREYDANSTGLRSFIDAKCNVNLSNRDIFVVCRDLYQSYTSFCRDNKIAPLADNTFGSRIFAQGFRKEHKKLSVGREYCYVGVSLK